MPIAEVQGAQSEKKEKRAKKNNLVEPLPVISNLVAQQLLFDLDAVDKLPHALSLASVRLGVHLNLLNRLLKLRNVDLLRLNVLLQLDNRRVLLCIHLLELCLDALPLHVGVSRPRVECRVFGL